MQPPALHELAHRTADGYDVSLLWQRDEDRVSVFVVDTRSGVSFEIEAAREKALDVFYHPFAYAAPAHAA